MIRRNRRQLMRTWLFPASSFCRHALLAPVLLVLSVSMFVGVVPSLGATHEVVILVSADFPPYHQAVRGFLAQIPSSSVVATYQMKGDTLQGRVMAKRIRASDATVVLAVGLKAALVARLEIIDTPVVFCLVLNPTEYGLPTSNMVGI